ncbi:MAG: PfkB family carbohydrate kinase [Gammaproteobacteria bacterium]|nr:PfkB family carbohydrate kinase [Gammaproteobacteria bacterium]
MAQILGIGNATLDIIHAVDRYPQENDEVRCIDRTVSRGGNVANTLVVLSQLGHTCSWAGVLVDTAEGRFVRDDLESSGIDTTASRMLDSGSMPVSSILVNSESGSRTIVHYRDLPEYTCADFESLDLKSCDWLHFEGRNIGQLGLMLRSSQSRFPSIPRSLEIEKPRPGIEALFGLVDVLLFSRDYARSHGYDSPEELLRFVHGSSPQADLYCTWGERGAVALDRMGRFRKQPAVAPSRVVDTLGAGDTFNAAVIHGYLAGLEAASRLRQACILAGKKCGQTGLAGLVQADS